ncbi:hypothetical protein THERMOS_708 [Bathymodiolus thermophilus thioautotrophic gill symbiont]|uniref:Uncharacterized protein n=1 Tax=Bathymodiolus thermophilus thioautotrophic gill symbiont TaxID=2360 RepID=A0A8H8XD73_9GAMM|nr:hypothetical protein THERMOS_708 [Bathymodiolus thermophilus thioautotrophic gill symbiont]
MLFKWRTPPKTPIQFMKSIKQHLFHPKIHQIAGYSPYFWLKNALFSNFPKSHWGF